MPKTKQNGKQQGTSARTERGSSKSSQKTSSKFEDLVTKLKGQSITPANLRQEVFNRLFDQATDLPEIGKYYIFEYDPKFKSILKKWDQYPLVQMLEIAGNNYLGANFHYATPKERLSYLNSSIRLPEKTLHYYIPKKADNLFFELSVEDVTILSQLPLEKFHENRRRPK